MKHPYRLLRGLQVLALALATGNAFAHGSQPHSDKAAPQHKEQQVFGIAGDAAKVARTIDIAMSDDMRFTPAQLSVREGETVRLRLRNRGAVLHELVIGTREDLDKHAELMRRFPDMEHDEPQMSHVPPGQRGEIVWQFNRAGEFEFACLIAGHYQAGMRGTITVTPRSTRP